MKKRVDTTRVDSVRHSTKKLVEMIQFMEIQHGWQVYSIGAFIRDILESVHSMLSEQEGFEFLENSVEAQQFIDRYFGTGKTAGRNLSISAQEEEMGRHFTKYYNKTTKHEVRNERARNRREMENPTIENDTNTFSDVRSNEIPGYLRKKYEWLPDMNKQVIDNAIKIGHSWEEIELMIDTTYKNIQTQNEEAAKQRDQTIKDAKSRAFDAGIVSENDDDSEFVSDENNSYENVKQFREKVDKEQEEELKEVMRTPPSDIVTNSDEGEEDEE